MRILGLSPTAKEKIASLADVAGSCYPIESGDTSFSGVPLMKYMWIDKTTLETVEWLEHVIASAQDRRAKILAKVSEDGGEFFREFVQLEAWSQTDKAPVLLLGLKNAIHPIRESLWTEEEIDQIRK